MNKTKGFYFRVIHRYLGFYLVGVMAVYALSGIVMLFRNDDTFKIVKQVETILPKNLDEIALKKALKIKRFSVEKEKGDQLVFN